MQYMPHGAWHRGTDEYLAALRETTFLSRIGGPYPDDPLLIAGPSLDVAVQTIRGMMLSPTGPEPFYPLYDEALPDARKVIYGSISRVLKGIFGLNALARKQATLHKAIGKILGSKILGRSSPRSPVSKLDAAVIEEHLEALLKVVGTLVLTSRLDSAPLLAAAADAAIQGYLPVDQLVEDGVRVNKVLIC